VALHGPAGSTAGKRVELDELAARARTQKTRKPLVLTLADEVKNISLRGLRDVAGKLSSIGRRLTAKARPVERQPIEQRLH